MMSWLDVLLEPMGFEFMQRALLTAAATSIVCAIFSCFLVLKGWSLMGDAISHAVLPGVVLAYLAGIPLAIGAFGSGLFCAVATGFIKEHCRVKEDSVMGIVFSGMFAAGLVLFSRVNTGQHLSHILFGNVLGVTDSEMLQTLIIAAVVTLAILFRFKDLVLFCFDPVQAKVIGLPVRFYHYALLCMLAMTIVAALQAVGVVLVVAMLITPGITAFLLCKTLPKMVMIAVTVSLSAAVSGTFISFYIDAATGPTIVLIQALFFLLALTANLLRKSLKPRQSAPIA
ncbi:MULTISPECIES: metal ABC transporter permease [Rahnella]|jgi:manganese/iron transport system permease protein|uniref:Metal ABC transporter permease n=1 Tax=Rahnella contaminans TaxID=2703882 RepID=A0A6M2B7M9_9GAMM|nr:MULTISPECIES: metal ABC transporter permease [Rahnella]KAB8311727.1 metal ABC transporter permease [Rouxiella chamberiensis]MBU9821140.1 metal ABC transporter permease [Rahnella sp. BCC 1045]MCS3424401.1 manganese/iron transport system permease protein [Rahnella sp. BIGb0603]MDF1894980.1 metal ABC transporter permease [Rahnella contaminans]NGX88692.1 metal ABC transporter permease [Rahnella contaminans]